MQKSMIQRAEAKASLTPSMPPPQALPHLPESEWQSGVVSGLDAGFEEGDGFWHHVGDEQLLGMRAGFWREGVGVASEHGEGTGVLLEHDGGDVGREAVGPGGSDDVGNLGRHQRGTHGGELVKVGLPFVILGSMPTEPSIGFIAQLKASDGCGRQVLLGAMDEVFAKLHVTTGEVERDDEWRACGIVNLGELLPAVGIGHFLDAIGAGSAMRMLRA